MNSNFMISTSKSQENIFFLMLHPNVQSLSQVIDDINVLNSSHYDGTIKTDLLLITGDRYGRYIEGKIKNGLIDKSSFKVSKEDLELSNLLENYYLSLPESDINNIYPISYRNNLKKIKLSLIK